MFTAGDRLVTNVSARVSVDRRVLPTPPPSLNRPGLSRGVTVSNGRTNPSRRAAVPRLPGRIVAQIFSANNAGTEGGVQRPARPAPPRLAWV